MGNPRILVVEDEVIVALDIQSKLRSRGYEVPELASSGEEAIEKAELLRPDLVLMDIQLDGQIDGVDAAEQIHRRFGTPIVYLTAYSDDRTLARAKAAEPFGYLLKPFEERKLSAAIEVALYKSKVDREKAILEDRLRQAQKMEAIGQLTTGVAYNFNNMLHGVVGNLDLALSEAPDELKPYLEAAEFDAGRAAKLVQQLIGFSWPEDAQTELVAPEDTAAEVVSLFRQILFRKPGDEIEVLFRTGSEVAPVLGSAAQLKQCLVNLCTNSQEAIAQVADPQSQPGRIELSVSMISRGAETGPTGTVIESGDYVVIAVTDNGVGIKPEHEDRIFEPFFSTKKLSEETNQATGQGKGLGLAMVYSYVNERQGWIEVESEVGAGTTVSIFLPAASSQVDGEDETFAPVLPPGQSDAISAPVQGTETVLVLADVDRFRRILTEMLERNGYEVRIGIDARDGLAQIEHDQQGIDLVVVDISASGPSSSETVAQIHRIQPELRLLVVTGFARTGAAWRGAKGVLNKPFTCNELMAAVRSILDS